MRAEQLAMTSKDLMLKEPFYGMFLITLNKLWSKDLPTAGVSKNGIGYQLMINPEFWDDLNKNHRLGLLKHELLHIGFFHLTDYEHLKDKKVRNIAMDLEINQYINRSDLPEGGMTIDLFPELKLKRKAGTQYYYDELMKAQKNNSCNALNQLLQSGMGETIIINVGGDEGDEKEVMNPNHEPWGEFEDIDEAEKKLIKTHTENILKEVAENITKSRGTVPGEFQGILERILNVEPPKFDWKGYLRRFTGGSQKVFTRKSRRKLNKRYYENPGIKLKPRRHILVGIDTSGSVSDKELKEFLLEIYHMKKTGTEITIVQCDTAISHIGDYDPRKDFEVHGRGGTSFQPVIDYYNDNLHKYTCLVYLTDGEAPAPSKANGRMLWVISTRGRETDHLPGPTIKLN